MLYLFLSFFYTILLELDFDPFTPKHLDGNTNFVLLFFMIGCQIKEFTLVKFFFIVISFVLNILLILLREFTS